MNSAMSGRKAAWFGWNHTGETVQIIDAQQLERNQSERGGGIRDGPSAPPNRRPNAGPLRGPAGGRGRARAGARSWWLRRPW